MTRNEQKEQRRLDILYKGLELFVSRGYKATKITDIAEELNISVGLLFHYFKSKENLTIDTKICPVLDYFEIFVDSIFNAVRNDINVARMFVLMPEAQRIGTPDRVRELALKVNIIEAFIPIIIRGQEDKSIKHGDPKVLSNAFFRSIYSICEGYALNNKIDLPPKSCMLDIIRRY